MKRWIVGALFVIGSFAGMPAAKAQTPFVGQIQNFPYTFCPVHWSPTNGQTMKITDDQALFSLLGTNYGGNGVTTFGLPFIRPTLTGNRFPLISCISLFGIFPSPS